MLKRIAVSLGCLVLLASLATTARADAISFSFIYAVNGGTFTANNVNGFSVGPGLVINVSDDTTHTNINLTGLASIVSGPTASWVVFSNILDASFGSGGSVSVTNPTLTPWVTGTTIESDYLARLSSGTGSGDGSFNVTYVDPAILALFGLGPAFQPTGAFSFNTSHNAMAGGTDTATVAGGIVTIYTPTPEPGTLVLLGTSILGLAGVIRRRVL
jgi:hypothetical protein